MTNEMGSAFKLMGYSVSDLSDVAIPFAVIIKARVDGESYLIVYAKSEVLSDDFNRVHAFGGTIQSFLEDVRKCPRGIKSELLFRHLAELSVGLIRLVVQSESGEGSIEDQLSRVAQQTWAGSLWPGSFVRL